MPGTVPSVPSQQLQPVQPVVWTFPGANASSQPSRLRCARLQGQLAKGGEQRGMHWDRLRSSDGNMDHGQPLMVRWDSPDHSRSHMRSPQYGCVMTSPCWILRSHPRFLRHALVFPIPPIGLAVLLRDQQHLTNTNPKKTTDQTFAPAIAIIGSPLSNVTLTDTVKWYPADVSGKCQGIGKSALGIELARFAASPGRLVDGWRSVFKVITCVEGAKNLCRTNEAECNMLSA